MIDSKFCKTCQEVLPVSEFHKHSVMKDGLRSSCKACRCAYTKKYWDDRREEKREKDKLYYLKESDKVKARAREWEINNPERNREQGRKWYKENTEKARESGRRYAQANPEKMREKRARRKAQKLQTTVEKVDYKIVLLTHGPSCHICKDAIDLSVPHPDPWSLTIDHVVPLFRGGSHTYDNLLPAHLSCNSRKGAW